MKKNPESKFAFFLCVCFFQEKSLLGCTEMRKLILLLCTYKHTYTHTDSLTKSTHGIKPSKKKFQSFHDEPSS